MPPFLNIIFCKMSEWHAKYAITKYIAAQNSAYAVAFTVYINLLTTWWIIASIWHLPFRSF